MTRQDREEAIRDNIAYADRVVESVVAAGIPIVTVGFSQGVAMAFRGGVRAARRASAIVAVGGDVPPDLLADGRPEFPPTLLARGERDDWYTASKLESDVAALRARGTQVETFVYAAAHEWTPDVAAAASTFIRRVRRQ
jgi:predicted esterase